MKTSDIEFMRGYACAIANIVYGHGTGTDIREALEAVGLTTLIALRKYKISDFDIEILKPVIEEIQNNKEYLKKIQKSVSK